MTDYSFALVGNPNSGKTTLFNALTGLEQRVGNWAGVTVEAKEGLCRLQSEACTVVDLPGIYSLVCSSAMSFDEQLTFNRLVGPGEKTPAGIINVVDATNLERHLYLSVQLRSLKIPMVVVLSRMDLAKRKGITIETIRLAALLQCPVFTNDSPDFMLKVTQSLLEKVKAYSPAPEWKPFCSSVQLVIDNLAKSFVQYPACLSVAERVLEGDTLLVSSLSAQEKQYLEAARLALKAQTGLEPEVALATMRYRLLEHWLKDCQCTPTASEFTQFLDKIVLHRFWGIPIFLGMMYLVFVFAISVGGIFEPCFDILSSAIFIEGVAHMLTSASAPNWLIALVASGIGTGLNTTFTFVPVIGAMFLVLCFLEDCGYMARAAFVMDRVMGWIGLPGKSFVPLVIGFGCNVPAIMATRMLETKRDRIFTVLMSPFMSCGARLAIFAVFVSTFFGTGGSLMVFLLYFIGICMAAITGLLLKHTLLRGVPAPLILELPLYHWPTWSVLCKQTWLRLYRFITKAGKLIVPLCVVVGALNTLGVDGRLYEGTTEQSILAKVGRSLTPFFRPMGIEEENWPATVGLLTGLLAKEVVVGTLNALYTEEKGGTILDEYQQYSMPEYFQMALASIPQKIGRFWHDLLHPLDVQIEDQWMDPRAFGLMAQRFHGKAGAFAYLIFILLYFPCVSTTAAMSKEVQWRWTLFSLGWTTILAYALAVIFYQLALFKEQPENSFYWIGGMLTLLGVVIWGIKKVAQSQEMQQGKRLPTRIVTV